ncbi:hypothetical protein Y1Q_0021491 [Alligator mississippiensis]|uniref:Uncharacterized protein n=1 Tax=Alligator mississippiensis TaxID=8496 RepID=A0A151P9U7_ALLMI|nr:hypothetical protein Y1Q_0021491 [Alligator mississippiensis]
MDWVSLHPGMKEMTEAYSPSYRLTTSPVEYFITCCNLKRKTLTILTYYPKKGNALSEIQYSQCRSNKVTKEKA